MTVLRVNKFGGIAPKVPARDLPQHMAQVARNCDLRNGELRPLKSGLVVWTPTKVGTVQSIYRWGGAFWFHWLTDVDVIRGPIAGDTTERTYWTGDGDPKVTDSSIATAGGGTNYPNNYYRLGIPKPANAPYTSRTQAGEEDCDEADKISITAYYTYVSAWGEEGPPSDPSTVLDLCEGDALAVTAMAVPSGAYNITKKRIYVDAGKGYQYAGEALAAATSFNVAAFSTAALGELCPSETWYQPPTDMQGLCMLPNGIAAAFAGNEILFSEPFVPHAWPPWYRLTTDYPIVSIKAAGQSLIVTTTGPQYLVSGIDPAAMSMVKLESQQSCVSKPSTVDMGAFVMFASPDGLVAAGANGEVQVVTEKWLTREQWQAYNPSSIHAYYWEGQYVAFYNNGTPGGFVFDPAGEGLKEISLYATAGFNALEEDALYLVVDGDIVKWNGSDTSLTYVWRSKEFVLPKPANLGAAQVKADAYPVTLRVYADGVLKHTRSVANSRGFRLPAGFLAERWEFEAEGTAVIHDVILAESMRELASV